MISPVRWYFLIACKRSLIAAIRVSFVSGRGGVISEGHSVGNASG